MKNHEESWEEGNTPAGVDRISEIPEEIMHHILLSLRSHKEAAKTCSLSRRWLNLWVSNSYPLVEFQGSRFESFAAATSKRLLAVPLLLDSFIISVQRSEDLGEEFHKLLSSASIGVDDGSRSPLKVVVKIDSDLSASFEGGMLLNCGRTKFLDLEGFNLSGLQNLMTCLDNLQELSLKHVRVSEESFPSCLANAPSLEKLSLANISGIDSLDISASNFPSLKYLYLHIYHRSRPEPPSLQLSSATLLETLVFLGNCTNLKVVSAPSVKHLTLLPVDEHSRSTLEELISKFPSLESLHFNARWISGNDKLLRITSNKLRELTLSGSNMEFEFEIDAPNLVELTIHAAGPKINFTAVNVHPTCRCVFVCFVYHVKITTSWFIELNNCLALLATRFRFLVFQLEIVNPTEISELDLSEVGCESTPLMFQHLIMGMVLPLQPPTFGEVHKIHLLDGLLWTLRPKTISVAHSHSDNSLFSYITKQIQMENFEKCCSDDKCWQHQFKDAKITSVILDDVSTIIDKSTTYCPSADIIFLIRIGKVQCDC